VINRLIVALHFTSKLLTFNSKAIGISIKLENETKQSGCLSNKTIEF